MWILNCLGRDWIDNMTQFSKNFFAQLAAGRILDVKKWPFPSNMKEMKVHDLWESVLAIACPVIMLSIGQSCCDSDLTT